MFVYYDSALMVKAFFMEDDIVVDVTKLKYVLYARKSTDDAKNQVRSIDDQIAECKQLAQRLGLHIAEIIIEKKSAKIPGKRPLFRQMLKDIQKGKYDGIICWNPDRLSRNMRESGDIIEMVDNTIIKDMKFVTHPFSRDANGKMLLGLVFVLSKQYSDNLSQNVRRGVRRLFAEGKSSAYKHGYQRDEEGVYRPHPTLFPLLRRAWDMRLAGESLETISHFLQDSGYRRTIKGKLVHPTNQRLSDIFKDPFYYGILIQANQQVDLRSIYTNFQPMITEQEYLTVQRLSDTRTKPYKQRTKRAPYLPLKMLLICAYCGNHLAAGASKGKSKRYLFYRCDGRYCVRKERGIRRNIRGKVLFDQIVRIVQEHVQFEEADYRTYLEGLKKLSKTQQEKILMDIHSKGSVLRDTQVQKRDLAYKLLHETHRTVRAINEEKLAELEETEARLKGDIAKLKQLLPDPTQTTLSIDEFLNTIKHAVLEIQSDDPVIRDIICRKLFLNLTIGDAEILSYQLNQPFAALVKHRHSRLGEPKAEEIELSGLENLLEEIIRAQNDTAQKEAIARLYQNVSKSYDYTYVY